MLEWLIGQLRLARRAPPVAAPIDVDAAVPAAAPPQEGLSPRDRSRLAGVHPDLVHVLELAHARMPAPLGFIVTEGLRSRARQAELFQAGATRTMDSRHITGHAADLAVTLDGGVRWDWPLYERLGGIVKLAAADAGIPIAWGGDWPRFRDGPHFELSRATYR